MCGFHGPLPPSVVNLQIFPPWRQNELVWGKSESVPKIKLAVRIGDVPRYYKSYQKESTTTFKELIANTAQNIPSTVCERQTKASREQRSKTKQEEKAGEAYRCFCLFSRKYLSAAETE